MKLRVKYNSNQIILKFFYININYSYTIINLINTANYIMFIGVKERRQTKLL